MSPVSTTDGWLQNTKQGGGTSQERWTYQTKIQTQNQDGFSKKKVTSPLEVTSQESST